MSGEEAETNDTGLQKPVRADRPTAPVQELLDTLAAQNVPHLNELTTEEARELFSNFFIQPPEQEVGRVETREVSGPNGPVPIRIYWPSESQFDEPLPVSLYMHGGGWVLGGLDTHDSVARSLTEASEGIVVAIDYRRGPEHPFPAAVEDSWAVARWVAENAGSIGADAGRMAVTGESAGGSMTAVLTFLAKDDDAVEFVHQLPIYPVTDLSGSWVGRLPDTFSIVNPADERQLSRRYLVPEDLAWFAERYLPYPYAANNIYVSPLLANDWQLEDLPPATVVTTGFGPLGDQGYLYAKRLQDAGVDVSIQHYPEMIHDFFNMEYLPEAYPDIPTARTAKRKAGRTLRAAFAAADGGTTGGEGDEDDPAYYQVDFIQGDPITELGEDGLYAEQDRLMRFAFGSDEAGLTEKGSAWADEHVRECLEYGHIYTSGDGDTAMVEFTVKEGCELTLSLAVHTLSGPEFDPETADEQELVRATTKTLGAGEHSLSVQLPSEKGA